MSNHNRALRSVAVQFWVNGAVVASYVPRLPGIRDRLGVDLATIGIIMAVATGVGLIGSTIQAPLIERFGTKTSMITGAMALVILLPLIGFMNNWWALLIVLGALSIADVVTDVAMNMQGSVLSSQRKVPVINRLHAMWSLGTVVGGIVASVMAALEVDLRVHLIGAAIVLAASLLYVSPGLLTTDIDPSDSVRRPTSSASATRVVLMFAALGGAAIVPEMINSDWSAFRLTDDLGASGGVAGLAYVSFTSGMVTGRMAGDTVVHRIGASRVLRQATVLAAAGILLATLVPEIGAVFVGLFFAGVGVSVMFPQLYDAAATHPRPAKALGGLTAGSRVALLGAPLAVGFMANTETLNVGTAIAIATVPAALTVWVLSSQLSRNA